MITGVNVRQNKAYLFGPFFGETSWEYFRFAPYAIHLKKQNPDIQTIVMTRPDRFDLYGQYADVLVPLKLENENLYEQSAFKLVGFDIAIAQRYCDVFRISFKKKYQIVDVHVPDFSSLRYKLKWQFPRGKMDYDFLPRKSVVKLVNNIYKQKNIVLTDEGYSYKTDKYHVVPIDKFKELVMLSVDNMKISYLGCLIQMIKKSKFVVSNLRSDVGRLAVLLNVPLIYPYRDVSDDNVFLMNPLKTPIFDCESIIEGVRFYENNI